MIIYKNYTREDLDRQYNARATVPDFTRIFEGWKRRSKEVRKNAPIIEDVRYGAGVREVLDVFTAPKPDSPLVAFFHGGYWQALDKLAFHFVAERFIERGIAVALVNYPLAPAAPMDEIVESCRKAMVWLYRHAADISSSPNRIFVCGHSAGGHITAMLMATAWSRLEADLPIDLIRGGCALSGLFDLHPIRLSYLNDKLAMDESTAQLNSPLYLSPACDRPVLVSVGAAESEEFHAQSKDFSSAWAEKGVPTNLMVIDGANHFSMLDQLTEKNSPLLQAFLQKVEDHP